MVGFIPLTVSLFSSLLGTYVAQPPLSPKPFITTVRFWTGQDANVSNKDGSNMDGWIPQAVLWGEDGTWVGAEWKNLYFSPHEGESPYMDVDVRHLRKDRSILPTYLQINAFHDDALCISAIQVGYQDGNSTMIFGDVPVRYCGWQGYPSATSFAAHGADYQPWCFWVDGNDSFGENEEEGVWLASNHKAKSINYHLPDFDGQTDVVEAYNNNSDLLCKSSGRMQAHPSFQEQIPMFKPPLIYGKGANNLDPQFVVDDYVRPWPVSLVNDEFIGDCAQNAGTFNFCLRRMRAARALQKKSVDTASLATNRGQNLWALFDSVQETHSVDYVCSQPNVVGPHYANAAERKFCRLDDRTVWDFCDDVHRTNCFDTESHTLWGDVAAPADGSVVARDAARIPLLSLQGRSKMGL